MLKKIIAFSLSAAMVIGAMSCGDPEDVVTSDAKEGGLVNMNSTQISYLSGGDVNVGVSIKPSTGVEQVKFYKSYKRGDDWSNEVLDQTIDVNAEGGEYEFTTDFTSLREGLTFEGEAFDETDANLTIGDYWNYRVVSVMADGREVINAVTIKVVVSNPYSGSYNASGVLHHPTAGDLTINETRTLTPLNPNTSQTIVAYFGNSAYILKVQVNEDNSITITGDVAGNPVQNDTDAGDSYYDPATGKLHLFYWYNAAAPRRLEEVLTPVE